MARPSQRDRLAALAAVLIAVGAVVPPVMAASPSPGPSASTPPAKPHKVQPVSPLSFPTPGSPRTAQVPLPYSADGIRYDVVSHGAEPNFYTTGYVEGTGWATGGAP